MNLKRSIFFYDRANRMSREGRLEEAVDDYCCAFLDRIDDLACSIEFILFYKLQLSRYFSNKKKCFLSLPEGDMVSDLIKESYDEFVSDMESSPFNVTSSGRKRLLENVKIVFPVQNDTEEIEEPRKVSK